MTPDSSVVIAAFAEWNEHHDAAVEALGDVRDLVSHVELEAYSVLTRMPEPFCADASLVAQYLRKDFSGERLALPEEERHGFVQRLARLSISGGAVYDAIVGLTANQHGHRLLSCDRRAAKTYERLSLDVVYV
ncbi:MAG: PIN domain-containing protein [Solirubrobacteraceae bacterium]